MNSESTNIYPYRNKHFEQQNNLMERPQIQISNYYITLGKSFNCSVIQFIHL